MDKLEELERRWRAIAEQAEEVVRVSRNEGQKDEFCGRQYMAEKCADDLATLRRDYVLVPREPSEADVRRAAVKVLEAWDELGAPNAYVAISIAHKAMIGAHADE